LSDHSPNLQVRDKIGFLDRSLFVLHCVLCTVFNRSGVVLSGRMHVWTMGLVVHENDLAEL